LSDYHLMSVEGLLFAVQGHALGPLGCIEKDIAIQQTASPTIHEGLLKAGQAQSLFGFVNLLQRRSAAQPTGRGLLLRVGNPSLSGEPADGNACPQQQDTYNGEDSSSHGYLDGRLRSARLAVRADLINTPAAS
jgi:hypothetical protein